MALSCCVLLGVGSIATSAAFTDASHTNASFASGSINAQVGDALGVGEGAPTPYTLSVLTSTAMYPGSGAAYSILRVYNAGTLPFTFTVSAYALTVAGAAPDAPVTALATSTRLLVLPIAAGGTCDAAYVASSLAGAAAVPTTTTVVVSTAPLASLASTRYCVSVFMPAGVAPAAAAQGASMRVTFRVQAAQT